MPDPANQPAPTAAAPFKSGALFFFGLMVVVAVGAGAVMLMGQPKPLAEDKIPWKHVENRAGLVCKPCGKPELLFFTADWCGPCKILKQHTLTDTKVSALIEERFTPMKIDLTDQNSPAQELAHDWRVDGIPTLIIVSREGKEVDRSVGTLDAKEMSEWLNKGLARAPK